MKKYADAAFYGDSYLLGRPAKIPDAEYGYFAVLASAEIRRRTFGRLDDLTEIPEEARMCCCEVAEKLYSLEAAKDENGMIVQSYGNDGQTATFKTDGLSETAVKKSVSGIISKWLGQTGLMYCGVE